MTSGAENTAYTGFAVTAFVTGNITTLNVTASDTDRFYNSISISNINTGIWIHIIVVIDPIIPVIEVWKDGILTLEETGWTNRLNPPSQIAQVHRSFHIRLSLIMNQFYYRPRPISKTTDVLL